MASPSPIPCHIVAIPSGKPQKQDSTQRQLQKGRGEHGNCFLYAAKIATGWKQATEAATRESCKRLTQHRKQIEHHVQTLWHQRATVLNILRASAAYLSVPLSDSQETKNWCIAQLPQIKVIIQSQKNIRTNTAAVAETFLSEFKASSETNLEQFSQRCELQERIAIHLNFLKKEIAFQGVFQQKALRYMQLNLHQTATWGKLSPKQRYHLVHEMFVERVAEIFGLELVTWTPLDPIETLTPLLKKGPLIASGFLDKARFGVAKPMDSDSSYQYFGWDNFDNQSLSQPTQSHAVVIFAAFGGTKKRICFVDPSNDSHPSKKRIAYTLPYEVFCKQVTNSYGIKRFSADDRYLWGAKLVRHEE